MYFLNIKELEISSSRVRHKARTGLSFRSDVTKEVHQLIKKENIFTAHSKSTKFLAHFCRDLLIEKRASEITLYEFKPHYSLCDMALVVSANSCRHTSALADHLIQRLRKALKISPLSVEGKREGQWVVLDYGSLIVHVFYGYVRKTSELHKAWQKHLLTESV